jgi:pimeloyl-ACP methyl ester carboxylesterase
MLVRSTTARLRAICALACFSGPALFGCAFEQGGDASDEEAARSVAQGLATDIAVYTNTSPASPWQNWSWWTTVALANADAPLASGSTSQIKATVQTAGGALSLAYATSDLTAADYDAISFDVRAPSSSSVRLALETLAGAGSGVQATVPVTTTWTRQTVKLTALRGSLTKFGKVDWIATQGGQTFYVDNVRLVAKVVTTTSATSTFPTAPITVKKNDVVALNSNAGPYSLYVPTAYDATHNTPAKLLLWLHGCGGNAYGDAWAVSPGGSQSWISVSVGGRDGACWNPSTDVPLALAALDDVKRRLNIDPRRVVIGGYSSGGDMAYRTAFYNAKRFAGVIAENTSPFRDTGSTQSASIAAAAWKLNVVHLAHVSDTSYPIGPVRIETDSVKTAGFPETRIERPGTHWDADTTSSGTNYDMRTYLLPHLDAGWAAPP